MIKLILSLRFLPIFYLNASQLEASLVISQTEQSSCLSWDRTSLTLCYPFGSKILLLLETVVITQPESQRKFLSFVCVDIAYWAKNKTVKPRHNILLAPNFRYSWTYLIYQVFLELCVKRNTISSYFLRPRQSVKSDFCHTHHVTCCH